MSPLGRPRLHLRATDSTNLRARELALRGAAHGTLVTAAEQSAGRGRHGRTWSAPPGRALLCSLVVREPQPLLPLTAGLAVAETVDAVRRDPGVTPQAQIKWPNDVLIARGKVAGILVESRLQEHWAVLGIGLNVALRAQDLPPELGDRAATLGLEPTEIEPVLERLLDRLTAWLAAPKPDILAAVRDRDALLGQPVHWTGGTGTGAGIDDDGRLLVTQPGGVGTVALDAGEVHLGPSGGR